MTILLAQDHDDMEYKAKKLKEEYKKWRLAINLGKNQICMYGRRKRNFKMTPGKK